MAFIRKQKMIRQIASAVVYDQPREVLNDDGVVEVITVPVVTNSDTFLRNQPPFDFLPLQDQLKAGIEVRQVSTRVLTPTQIEDLRTVVTSQASNYIDNLIRTHQVVSSEDVTEDVNVNE